MTANLTSTKTVRLFNISLQVQFPLQYDSHDWHIKSMLISGVALFFVDTGCAVLYCAVSGIRSQIDQHGLKVPFKA